MLGWQKAWEMRKIESVTVRLIVEVYELRYSFCRAQKKISKEQKSVSWRKKTAYTF